MEDNYRHFRDKLSFKEENHLESPKLNTYFKNLYRCTVHSDIRRAHSPTNALILI
jgi:hypothetical protein